MDGVFQSLSVGEFYYPNGEKYEGDWKNDMRNGRGTLSRTPRQAYTITLTGINMMECGKMTTKMDEVTLY